MPKINRYLSKLQYVGEGSGDGSIISLNRVPFFGPSCSTGGWYDVDHLACQYYTETQHPIFLLIHKDTKESKIILDEGAMGIVTGGKRWFAQTLTQYLLDGVPTDKHAYCFGLDGTLVWHPFSGLGLYIEDKQITPNQVSNVTYLENGQVVYIESGKIKSNIQGAEDIVSLGGPGEFGNLRAYWWNDNLWVMYQWYTANAIVTHPYNNPNGYLLGSGNCYAPDAYGFDGKPVFLWSISPSLQAEHMVEIIELGIIFDLRTLIVNNPIIPINKKCWLTWFEFNQPPPANPDGNAILKIRYDVSGSIVRLGDGSHFANWVDGSSVEEIEQKVANSQLPCVAYWDGRYWPRFPKLRKSDWLALQAYCLSAESPLAFESIMRNLIWNAQQAHGKVALVCQCYTSNTTLTKDLKGLVPVFAKLANNYPSIDHLLVFSDQNRATGLNDHPELRPYWKELYSGITGEPMAETEEIPNEFNVILSINSQFPHLLQANTRESCGEFTEKVVCELIKKDSKWGHVGKRPGQNQHNGHAVDAVMYNITSTTKNVRDIIISSGTGKPTNPSWGEEENGGQPWMGPVNCESVPVPPTLGSIDIVEYDHVCHRSDPKGCLIRFDIFSPNPVVSAEFDLEGDGEPAIPVSFSDAERQDGRYVRGFAFKFTVNGKWVLKVTAKDNKGNLYQSDGKQIIEVTF